MANFNSFKVTNSGLDLLYKCQTGKQLKFSKFMLGDGNYTGSIRDLSDLVNPVKSESIVRLNITGTGSTKKLIIGFDLTNEDITQGFYLREIGIYATDPDTNTDVLVYYSNSGDTADYIPAISTDTVMQKLINAEIYISDVAEITATIDSSLVYATNADLQKLQNNIPTKTSDLTKDDVYTKEEVNNKLSSAYIYKGTVASYEDLPNSSQSVGDVYNVEETGMNYAWTGTNWDALGGVVDLSNYLQKTGDGSSVVTTFSESASRDNITSGETLSNIFGKIKKFFTDIKTIAFTGSFSDLSNKPTITSQTIVQNFWSGTQAEYDALESKNATTLYLIDKE